MYKTPKFRKRAGLQSVFLFLFIAWQAAPISAVVRNCGDQVNEGADGIKLLNDTAWQEAIACGKEGVDCAVTPYLLCPSNPRYSVRLATPYSRVAFSVHEAQRTHRQARPPSRGAANHWGVGLFVFPANDSQMADSIEKVSLRRGDETIQPTTITLAPVVVGREDGRKVQRSKGFFAFPMDAFRPQSDVTVVLIGPSGQTTCTLDRRKLSILR